jgi:arylsulfatase A-like enzyme
VEVPLVIRYPAAYPAGERVSGPVSNQQLAATLVGLTGAKTVAFPGGSLLTEKGPVLAEVGQRSLVAANWPSSRGWSASLLGDRYQVIQLERDGTQLFDLTRDPEEVHDLAHSSDPATMEHWKRIVMDRLPPSALDWHGFSVLPWFSHRPDRSPPPTAAALRQTPR